VRVIAEVLIDCFGLLVHCNNSDGSSATLLQATNEDGGWSAQMYPVFV
jgi:hypothetical protein